MVIKPPLDPAIRRWMMGLSPATMVHRLAEDAWELAWIWISVVTRDEWHDVPPLVFEAAALCYAQYVIDRDECTRGIHKYAAEKLLEPYKK